MKSQKKIYKMPKLQKRKTGACWAMGEPGLSGKFHPFESVFEAPIFFLFLFCFAFCFCCCFVFRDRVSLWLWSLPGTGSYRPGWPRTHRDPPASASQVLGLKVCATTARQNSNVLKPYWAVLKYSFSSLLNVGLFHGVLALPQCSKDATCLSAAVTISSLCEGARDS